MKMRRATGILLASTLLLIAGCGPQDAAIDGEGGGEELVETEAALGNEAVTVIDSGNWRKILGCSGQCYSSYYFWVDLRVRNDAYNKTVGIRWTRDNWASYQTAYAKYEVTLSDGFERWGLDVHLGDGMQAPGEIQYAAFVEMNGAKTWDPHNNHYVYKPVLPHKPVTLVTSKVAFTSGVGAKLSGVVRAYNLGSPKYVYVRYSTDGWVTSKETRATWVADHDWKFTTPSLGLSTLPDKVEYVVRLRVNGKDYWDNNGGQNYQFTLKPQFSLHEGTLPNPVSGIVTLTSNYRSDLPIKGHRVRLDAQSWKNGATLTFSTNALADGAHSVTFEVTLEGGFIQKNTVSFQVKNRVKPLGNWALTNPNPAHPELYPWHAAADTSGRIYVMWGDSTVQRYDAFGTTTPPMVFPAIASAQSVTVDAQHRVYVLVPWGEEPGIHRFLSNGTKDATYGQQGVVSISGVFAGNSICYPGYFAAIGNDVLLSDTCNSRLLRFNAYGAFIDQVQLDTADGIAESIYWDGTTAWVAQARRINAVQVKSGMLQKTASVAIAPGLLNSPGSIWRSAAGELWVIDTNDRLVVFDANGNQLTAWLGGHVTQYVGGFPLARALLPMTDGSVAVLSVDAKRLERFAGTLR